MNRAVALASMAKFNVRKKCTPRVKNPAIDYPLYRREPGGLTLAVLLAVGDGYSTSVDIAALLGTSVDNVNGALSRLLAAFHIVRWGNYPVEWTITDAGKSKLRSELRGDSA